MLSSQNIHTLMRFQVMRIMRIEVYAGLFWDGRFGRRVRARLVRYESETLILGIVILLYFMFINNEMGNLFHIYGYRKNEIK